MFITISVTSLLIAAYTLKRWWGILHSISIGIRLMNIEDKKKDAQASFFVSAFRFQPIYNTKSS